jgi:hypothetical protein
VTVNMTALAPNPEMTVVAGGELMAWPAFIPVTARSACVSVLRDRREGRVWFIMVMLLDCSIENEGFCYSIDPNIAGK